MSSLTDVEVLDKNSYDIIVNVNNDEAVQASRALAAREGIFCGISSGGTFAAALKVAETAPENSTLLAMLPDTGERYLRIPLLFEGINEGTDHE